jgi:hypothetical protein
MARGDWRLNFLDRKGRYGHVAPAGTVAEWLKAAVC